MAAKKRAPSDLECGLIIAAYHLKGRGEDTLAYEILDLSGAMEFHLRKVDEADRAMIKDYQEDRRMRDSIRREVRRCMPRG